MFPSYLFLHHAMDKTSYIEVRNARGLVRILGERWDRLGVIPAAEIEAIQKAVVARFPLFPIRISRRASACTLRMDRSPGWMAFWCKANRRRGSWSSQSSCCSAA
jgi:hypothetical protein